MKILIVDDSRAMRVIVRNNLRTAGFGHHDLLEAVNGVEAHKVICEQNPDVVLSDWNMPEMTGIELLNKISTDGLKVKFGFITSEGTPEMRATAVAAGALFYISKPFTAETFEEILGPF